MRKIAIAEAGALAAIGFLHVVWAFSSWPLADRAGFADAVVGVPEADLPSRGLTLLVAAALLLAALVVAAQGNAIGRLGPDWLFRLGTWAVAAVLLLRGLGGLVTSAVLDSGTETFRRLDLLVYSPLCLLLAAGAAAVVAVRKKPQVRV